MTERRIEQWFAHYSDDHRNSTNQRIHVLAVPLILWSVVALLWCVPSPGTWFRAGFWAGLAMFAAWMFYYRASRKLGLGMLATFVLLGWMTLGLTGVFRDAMPMANLAHVCGLLAGMALGYVSSLRSRPYA